MSQKNSTLNCVHSTQGSTGFPSVEHFQDSAGRGPGPLFPVFAVAKKGWTWLSWRIIPSNLIVYDGWWFSSLFSEETLIFCKTWGVSFPELSFRLVFLQSSCSSFLGTVPSFHFQKYWMAKSKAGGVSLRSAGTVRMKGLGPLWTHGRYSTNSSVPSFWEVHL